MAALPFALTPDGAGSPFVPTSNRREGGVNDLFRLIEQVWPYLIVLAPGLWALWLRWTDLAKGRVTQRAELIQIAQDAAGQQIGRLQVEIDHHREQIDRQRERIDELESELADLQRRHNTMIADKDAKITLLEGELRNAMATIAAYEELLVRHNIPPPRRGQTYWAVEDGNLTPSETSKPGEPG